jgi:hypothetical protein
VHRASIRLSLFALNERVAGTKRVDIGLCLQKLFRIVAKLLASGQNDRKRVAGNAEVFGW